MTKAARDWLSHPPYIEPAYKSTQLRGPTKPLVSLAELFKLTTLSTPPAASKPHRESMFSHAELGPLDHDLTKNGMQGGEPLGERIIVTGCVRDAHGSAMPGTLVEVWQANAAGRYVHETDQHDAPLDPNFFGAGRCLTDSDGCYRFCTVKPGAYPWGNHDNAWRPAHIHLSLVGTSLASRLSTQMYFPGDPLLAIDPIFLGVPATARERLVASFSLDVTQAGFALGYVFDVVLAGGDATPEVD